VATVTPLLDEGFVTVGFSDHPVGSRAQATAGRTGSVALGSATERMTRPSVRLVVLPASSEGRRVLGPLAWATLEALALRVAQHDGAWVAGVSARSLAGELAVGKNTAAAALRRLGTAGLLRSQPSRRAGGRYAGAGYELDLDACRRFGLVIDNGSAAVTEPDTGGLRRSAPCSQSWDTTGETPLAPVAPPPVSRDRRHGRSPAEPVTAPIADRPQPSLFDALTQPDLPHPKPSLSSSQHHVTPDLERRNLRSADSTCSSSLPTPIRTDALAPGVPGVAFSVSGNLNGNLNGAGQC
jgi:hypothetical protein